MAFCLRHLVESDNIWVRDLPEDRDLAVDLGKSRGVIADRVASNELDGYLNTTILFPAEFDFAELALSDCVAEVVVAKLCALLLLGVVLPALRTSASVVLWDWWRYRIVNVCASGIVAIPNGMRNGFIQSLALALDVHFWLRNNHAVEDFAGLSGGLF